MKKFKALIQKELYHLFHSPVAWIFAVLFLLLNNFFYFNSLFLIGQATMRPYFTNLSLVLLFFVSAAVMSAFSEEKKSKTLEILLSLPVKKWQIAAAKLLSFVIFFAAVLLFTISIPITLYLIGNPDVGPILTGYLGTLLLASFYAGLGIYISTFFKEQVVTALVSGLILFGLHILGQNFVLERVPFQLQYLLSFLSPRTHFLNFAKGLINLGDVFYFISADALLLWLTIKKVGFEE
jgi:ABC-2 type transport system permease protein